MKIVPGVVYAGTVDGEHADALILKVHDNGRNYLSTISRTTVRTWQQRVVPVFGRPGAFRKVGHLPDVSDAVRLVPERPLTWAQKGALWSVIRESMSKIYPDQSPQEIAQLDANASEITKCVVDRLNDRDAAPAERRYGDIVVGGAPAEHERTGALARELRDLAYPGDFELDDAFETCLRLAASGRVTLKGGDQE